MPTWRVWASKQDRNLPWSEEFVRFSERFVCDHYDRGTLVLLEGRFLFRFEAQTFHVGMLWQWAQKIQRKKTLRITSISNAAKELVGVSDLFAFDLYERQVLDLVALEIQEIESVFFDCIFRAHCSSMPTWRVWASKRNRNLPWGEEIVRFSETFVFDHYDRRTLVLLEGRFLFRFEAQTLHVGMLWQWARKIQRKKTLWITYISKAAKELVGVSDLSALDLYERQVLDLVALEIQEIESFLFDCIFRAHC